MRTSWGLCPRLACRRSFFRGAKAWDPLTCYRRPRRALRCPLSPSRARAPVAAARLWRCPRWWRRCCCPGGKASRRARGRGGRSCTGVEAPCVEVVSTRQLGIGDIVASLRCRAQLDDVGVEPSLGPELASHPHRAACEPDRSACSWCEADDTGERVLCFDCLLDPPILLPLIGPASSRLHISPRAHRSSRPHSTTALRTLRVTRHLDARVTSRSIFSTDSASTTTSSLSVPPTPHTCTYTHEIRWSEALPRLSMPFTHESHGPYASHGPYLAILWTPHTHASRLLYLYHILYHTLYLSWTSCAYARLRATDLTPVSI
ncbi:hypothetical protein B0H14DRAFT_450558 [Mycena olivaceomarginata]|nr:hypothetical protein B0H14DRAFT_450558 [Mycena olivaceomarginata]